MDFPAPHGVDAVADDGRRIVQDFHDGGACLADDGAGAVTQGIGNGIET